MPVRKPSPGAPTTAEPGAKRQRTPTSSSAQDTALDPFAAAQGLPEGARTGFPGPCLDTREAAAFLLLNEK